jgi:hemerythrin
MSFFVWKESFNIGISNIDEQHRSIVDKINELHDSHGNAERGTVAGIIADLTRYTIDHFTLEEQMFDRVSYPGSQAHRRQHELFREKLADLGNDFDKGRSGVAGETLQFLKEWFMDHILNEDMKYKPYIGTLPDENLK